MLGFTFNCLPAAEKAKTFSHLDLLPAIVAGAIVVVGWMVVERFARERERRADLRAAIQDLDAAVREVQETATSFYRLAGSDPHAAALATLIRAKFTELSSMIRLLGKAGISIAEDELLKAYRQAVTGGEFESMARQPLPETSSVFKKMAGDGQALMRAVRLSAAHSLLKVPLEKAA